MRSLAKIAVVAVACTVAALAGYLLHAHQRGQGSDSSISMAPDLSLPGIEGGERRLSEWRGRYVLVNFWATWCTPCLNEIPLLIDAQTAYGGRGLQVVGPAMDEMEAVRIAAPRMGINYPVMAGDSAVANAMNALGDELGALPFSVLIAPDGRILYRQHGEFTAESLQKLLDRHLP
jgi:peroxiredoxin